MKRLPKELDELMWELAERDDAAALDEFVQRNPDLRSEMAQRLRMVRELRDAKPTAAASRFSPTPRRAGPPRWAFVAVGAATLAAVAFAGYGAVQLLGFGTKDEPVAQAEPQVQAQPFTPAPQPAPTPVSPAPRVEDLPFDAVPPVMEVDPFTRPITIVFEEIALHDALRAVGMAAGMEVTLAPGLPNPAIVIDYREKPTQEVLRDMGDVFAFTAVPEGSDRCLVLPVVEGASATSEAPRRASPHAAYYDPERGGADETSGEG